MTISISGDMAVVRSIYPVHHTSLRISFHSSPVAPQAFPTQSRRLPGILHGGQQSGMAGADQNRAVVELLSVQMLTPVTSQSETPHLCPRPPRNPCHLQVYDSVASRS